MAHDHLRGLSSEHPQYLSTAQSTSAVVRRRHFLSSPRACAAVTTHVNAVRGLKSQIVQPTTRCDTKSQVFSIDALCRLQTTIFVGLPRFPSLLHALDTKRFNFPPTRHLCTHNYPRNANLVNHHPAPLGTFATRHSLFAIHHAPYPSCILYPGSHFPSIHPICTLFCRLLSQRSNLNTNSFDAA